MTQIGGVFSFPLLETTEEVVNTRDCPEPEPATDTPHVQSEWWERSQYSHK